MARNSLWKIHFRWMLSKRTKPLPDGTSRWTWATKKLHQDHWAPCRCSPDCKRATPQPKLRHRMILNKWSKFLRVKGRFNGIMFHKIIYIIWYQTIRLPPLLPRWMWMRRSMPRRPWRCIMLENRSWIWSIRQECIRVRIRINASTKHRLIRILGIWSTAKARCQRTLRIIRSISGEVSSRIQNY